MSLPAVAPNSKSAGQHINKTPHMTL